MAIQVKPQINGNKETTEWLQEMSNEIRGSGDKNAALQSIIEMYWIQPLDELRQFAEMTKPLNDSLWVLIQEAYQSGQLSRKSLQTYLNFYDTAIPNMAYRLYYNVIKGIFTTEPTPFETFLVYREVGFLYQPQSYEGEVIGHATLAYLAKPSPETKGTLTQAVIEHMALKSEDQLAYLMTEHIQETRPEAWLEHLHYGVVLEADLLRDPIEEDVPYYWLILKDYYLSHGCNDKQATRRALKDIVHRSKGDFSYIASTFNERMVADREYTLRQFVKMWGAKELIDEVFYDDQDGSQPKGLDISSHEFWNLNLISCLSDEEYEELFSKYLRVITSDVDFPVLHLERRDYISAVSYFLKDKRSKPLLKQWGGLYTTSPLLGRVTQYRPEVTALDCLRFNGLPGGNVTYYIPDEEYAVFTELVDELDELAIWSQSRINGIKRYHDMQIRPASELKAILSGSAYTVEDFPENPRINYQAVYIPAFSPKDRQVVLNDFVRSTY